MIPLSTFCFVFVFSVILLTGELRDVIRSLCISSVEGLSGDVMKWLPPAKSLLEQCERCCFLNMVDSWRRAGMEATIIPIFRSTLVPRSAR